MYDRYAERYVSHDAGVVGACAGQHGLCYSQCYHVIACTTVSTHCCQGKVGCATKIDQSGKISFVERRCMIISRYFLPNHIQSLQQFATAQR